MLKLEHPFNMIIAGPSQSGKTVFTLKLIDNLELMIEPVLPRKILYCYKEYQPKKFDPYNSSGRIQFFKGLPSHELFDGKEPTLVVLDDLMGEMDGSVAELFTTVSHHRDLSVIFIAQNLFPKNKHARTASLNAHYLVVYKNPRDVGQFAVMARQIFGAEGGNYKFAVEAFKEATDEPHGYLFIDMKAHSVDNYRLRTNIFPGEQTYVWVDRKLYKPTAW